MTGETYTFLSFGGGVQTTAILLMHPDLKFQEAVFADTGGENPETYTYIEKYHKPFCEEHGIKFTTVKGQVQTQVFGSDEYIMAKTLEEQCLTARITPSMQFRFCTDRWKIVPIRKYVKEKQAERAVALMGISYDEIQRMHDPHHKDYTVEYPLVDRRITREMCKKIILDHGWPLPPKSGCFFCPFSRREQLRLLYFNHRDLFLRAQHIEENGQRWPEFYLGNKPLRDIAAKLKSAEGTKQTKLDAGEDDDGPCDSGSCMV